MPNAESDLIQEAAGAIQQARKIVILTGAGVSAESGIPTFRDAQTGLWARFKPEELASPDAFRKDPALVWDWYRERQRAIRRCEPNPAHHALAAFQLRHPDTWLVTQNVDGLHQRALAQAATSPDHTAPTGLGAAHARIVPLHGDILSTRCTACSYTDTGSGQEGNPAETIDPAVPPCPACGQALRPAVVWFGEALDPVLMERAFGAAQAADLCLVVGTEAVVYPAASIPEITLEGGGTVVEVNPKETPLSAAATWCIRGPAGHVLPRLLRRWAGG
jgi:NAD-dependent deacetylase